VLTGYAQPIRALAFGADGKVQPVAADSEFRKDPSIAASALDPNGQRQAVAYTDGRLIVQTPDATATLCTLAGAGEASGIRPLSVSPDGNRLASGNHDGTILLWDVEAGKRLHELKGHTCYISCLAFTPDGQRLASGSEDWAVKLWDVVTGRDVLTLTGHR